MNRSQAVGGLPFACPRGMRRVEFACVIFWAATSATSGAAIPNSTGQPWDDAASDARGARDLATRKVRDVQEVQIATQPDRYADTDPSALTDFSGILDPFGSWVDDPTYGTVWIPSRDVVGADFAPYQTAGHWEYDQADYVWVSDYAWGWVPFHYGRWVFIEGAGWAWIPGRTYAPAWVNWQVGDAGWDYYGWSPMPPDWIWYGGVAVGLSFVPYEPYGYVPRTHLFDHHLHRHLVRDKHASEVARHMQPYEHLSPGGRDRPFARSHVRGPAPNPNGRPPVTVVQLRPGEHGETLARNYAQPSTARELGAKPPSPHVVRPRPQERPPSKPERGVRSPEQPPATPERQPTTAQPSAPPSIQQPAQPRPPERPSIQAEAPHARPERPPPSTRPPGAAPPGPPSIPRPVTPPRAAVPEPEPSLRGPSAAPPTARPTPPPPPPTQAERPLPSPRATSPTPPPAARPTSPPAHRAERPTPPPTPAPRATPVPEPLPAPSPAPPRPMPAPTQVPHAAPPPPRSMPAPTQVPHAAPPPRPMPAPTQVPHAAPPPPRPMPAPTQVPHAAPPPPRPMPAPTQVPHAAPPPPRPMPAPTQVPHAAPRPR